MTRNGKPGGALQQASDKQLRDIHYMTYALSQILTQIGHEPGLAKEIMMLRNDAENIIRTKLGQNTVAQFRDELSGQ